MKIYKEQSEKEPEYYLRLVDSENSEGTVVLSVVDAAGCCWSSGNLLDISSSGVRLRPGVNANLGIATEDYCVRVLDHVE